MDGQITSDERPAEVYGRIFTIPNIISMLRLVGVPAFLWAILTGHDGWAILFLMLSGITDYADGKIARVFGMTSRLGELLDPIADRLYILSTLIGLTWRDIIPLWLLVILVAREAVMAIMLLVLKQMGQVGLPVHYVGKAATFNLLYAFPLLLLAARTDWIGQVAQPIGWAFAWWGVILYWLAAVLYLLQAVHVMRREREEVR